MAHDSRPWGYSGQSSPPTMYQDRWRLFLGGVTGEGVVNDRTHTGLQVTASGSSASVSVGIGEAVIQGVHYLQDASESINVGAAGIAPTSGQTRIDYVVLEYDPSTQTVTAKAVPGNPASSGATPPTLTRSTTGVWQWPLARITRVGNVAITSGMVVDFRSWAGPHYGLFSTSAALPADAPLGSSAFVGDELYQRVWTGSAIAWRNETNPDWISMSGVPSASGSADYRLINGGVQFRGQRNCLTFPGDGSIRNFPDSTMTTICGYTVDPMPAADRHVACRFLTASYGNGIMDVRASGVIEVKPAAGTLSQTVSLDGIWIPL